MSQTTTGSPIKTAALEYLARRWSVIPVGADKRPLVSSWKPYQTRLASPEEVESWPHRGQDFIDGCLSGVEPPSLRMERPGRLVAEKHIHVRQRFADQHFVADEVAPFVVAAFAELHQTR